MHRHAAAVPRHDPGQVQHLFPGTLGGVGIAEEVDALQLHAALADHIAGHRGVDASGKQQRCLAAHTGGQASGTGTVRTVDIGPFLPDLHIHRILRVVHVHQRVRILLRQQSSDLLGDLDGRHGELLVRPLAFHLEALRRHDLIAKIVPAGIENGVDILFAAAAAAHGCNAEDPGAGLPGAV